MPKKKTTRKTKKESSRTAQLARTPIVAVMGHVDHGKTSLLDAIRGTKVQEKEAGGITQNTRAHSVTTKSGQKITFIDTPGHEAFSNMRSRGAKVTDIVMLVIAADDGIQPQTIESIKFAKEAKVPIVVAANKMDITGANADKIKQELSQHDVLVEEYGGDVLFTEVSAKTKKGLDDLLENLLLQAEILELKNTKVKEGKAAATVLEAHIDESLGPVVLAIVKGGNIQADDVILSSKGTDKIRQVLDEDQKEILKAEEGDPVWLIGLDEALEAGEQVIFFEDERDAKKYYKELEKSQGEDINIAKEVDEGDEEEEQDDAQLLAMLLSQNQEKEEVKKLNVILKADTKGTLEAVSEKLEELSDDEVEVSLVKSGTGDITQKEIELAKTTRAIVLGFQVGISKSVVTIAKREKVLYRTYEIIYDLIDEVDAALDSLVEPEEEEIEVARAKVKQVFKLSNGQIVGGSEVTKGNVIKGYSIFVERGDSEIGRGKITSLKQNKDEVKEVKKGQDCGILIEPQIELEEGDEIVCYKVEKL